MGPQRVGRGHSGLPVYMICLLVTFGLFAGSVPSYGYWLPWANDEAKIKKSVQDVWKALIDGDQRALELMLTGKAVKAFIEQESQQIKALDVKDYSLRFKKVQANRSGVAFGFAEYEREARLRNGKKIVTPVFSVLQQEGGLWKVVTGMGVKKNQENEENSQKDTGQEKGKRALERMRTGTDMDRVTDVIFEQEDNP
jgi:hypothetical protein